MKDITGNDFDFVVCYYREITRAVLAVRFQGFFQGDKTMTDLEKISSTGNRYLYLKNNYLFRYFYIPHSLLINKNA